MTQGLSYRSVKAEAPVQSQGPASRIRGGSNDIGTAFLLVFRFSLFISFHLCHTLICHRGYTMLAIESLGAQHT